MNLYKYTCRHINKSRGLHTVFKDGQAYTQTPYVPFSKIQCPFHENCACPFWKLDETLSVSVKTEVRILAVLDNAYMNLMVHRSSSRLWKTLALPHRFTTRTDLGP